MARSVFILFSVAIILMIVLVVSSNVQNQKLSKQAFDNAYLIDSLQTELSVKDITIGRDELIIEQLREKYPTEVQKLYDETE
jgi:hypothetical protein